MRPLPARASYLSSVTTGAYAFLASACAMESEAPALVPTAYFPYTSGYALKTFPQGLDPASRWQLAAESPWAPYEKQTLLSALDTDDVVPLPDVQDMESVQRAIGAARSLQASDLPPDAMWVVDLRGAASVAFAVGLTSLQPVITFNNWPSPTETVPAEEALSALLAWQPTPVENPRTARPVFVLDAWRLAYAHARVPMGDVLTDNRYILTEADLPDPETLAAHGIRSVIYVVESSVDSPVEEDDLNAIFLRYQYAGIKLYLADVDALAYWSRAARNWQSWLPQYEYYPHYRATLVNDPTFYATSPGGFGGSGAVASGYGGHGGG